MEYVEKTETCWLWKGRRCSGYGVMTVAGYWVPAHRLSHEIFKGAIPEGLLIRHTCDNPPCVNPAHLIPGTPKENVDDMLERQRHFSKLSQDSVLEMRANKYALTNTQLAQRYRVTVATVAAIMKGRTWRHVPLAANVVRLVVPAAKPRVLKRKGKTLLELIWERVEKTPACWIWKGKHHYRQGYGVIMTQGRTYVVHRVLYAEMRAPIARKMLVRKCATRGCVNPEHYSRA
jgi:hypothetical protein